MSPTSCSRICSAASSTCAGRWISPTTTGATATALVHQGTRRLLARRLRLAGAGGAMNAFPHFKATDRRRPDPLHPRARQGARADAADPHPRMAVDVLGLAEGHPAAHRSRGVRRRSRRRVRRDRALVARLRLLDAARADRDHYWRARRPVGEADAGRARLRSVRRAGRRLGRTSSPPSWATSTRST